MMSRVRLKIKAICVALAILVGLPAVASAKCVSQKEARRFVNSGEAISLSQALQRRPVSGKIVRVALCKNPGNPPFYRLAVLGPGGRLNKIVIPAN